jgi:hypothetical protein
MQVIQAHSTGLKVTTERRRREEKRSEVKRGEESEDVKKQR